MSPRKLTAADKKEIVKIYRSSADSTAALAARYGVSTSTVSRLLKSHIPEAEYDILMSEKRNHKVEFNDEETLMEPPIGPDEETLDESTLEDRPFPGVQLSIPSLGQVKPFKRSESPELRRVRRRSSALAADDSTENSSYQQSGTPKPIIKTAKVAITQDINDASVAPEPEPIAMITTEGADDDEDEREDLSAVAIILGEDMGDLLDDEEDFEEDEGGDDEWSDLVIPALSTDENVTIQVLPLSAANLPRTCYIVIDKFAELVAKPLREFAELGNLPTEEVPHKTLPIFDNQRVAKRFSSSHTHRVIKVPDSRLFQKTTRHLAAKGITRLLVDGQIYSLR